MGWIRQTSQNLSHGQQSGTLRFIGHFAYPVDASRDQYLGRLIRTRECCSWNQADITIGEKLFGFPLPVHPRWLSAWYSNENSQYDI